MNYNKHEPIPTWVWWTFAVTFLVVVVIAIMLNREPRVESPCYQDAYWPQEQGCIDAR